MFLEYYGLREQPFGVTPNPRYLYHSPMHREALASLIYGIEADLGFAALIADPGMGKTTLLFYLLEKFRDSARTALIFQTLCSPLEFLRYLASELEIQTTESDPVALNDRIKEVLVQEAQKRRRVIVIVDEAQNLDESVLETIRLLSDFETQNFKLLHIVLAGQLQLAEKLARPSMAQLLQRISMLNRLRPLTADEIRSYIEYRLKVAGYKGPTLFTQDAVELIALSSGGVPRKINRICFNALSLGCAMGKRAIDVQVIREVGSDLDIGDLLYQKGAITDEVTGRRPESAAEREPSSAAPKTPKKSAAPPSAPSLRQWPSFPGVTAAQPHVASVPPLATQQSSRPVLSTVVRSRSTDAAASVRIPIAPAPPAYASPGFSPPRTTPAATSNARPFPPAGTATQGIARPLTSAQTKPAVAPAVAPKRSAPLPKPVVMPAREKEPSRRSHSVGIALSMLFTAVLALAGWTVWVKSPVHDPSSAVQAAAQPARAGHEIDLPVSESAPKIDDAIERGKSAAKEKQGNASSMHDVVKVSAARKQPSLRRGSGTTVVDFEQQEAPPSLDSRASSAELIRKVPPIYPTEARRSGIQGSVTVAAVIGTDGRPKSVRAVSGNPILARAATDAVSRWLYQPYYVNGRPVEVETEIVVDFALR